jgi:hypothetical protein
MMADWLKEVGHAAAAGATFRKLLDRVADPFEVQFALSEVSLAMGDA